MTNIDLYNKLVYLWFVDKTHDYSIVEWLGTDKQTIESFLTEPTSVVFTIYANLEERSPSGWNMVKVSDLSSCGAYSYIVVDEWVKE